MAYPSSYLYVMIFTLFCTETFAKEKISVTEKDGNIILKCPLKVVKWKKDHYEIDNAQNETLSLGSIWDDPQGYFTCKGNGQELHIGVFVRMCKNCIEMDGGTISGFIVADIIMIGLIALAVYYVSGSEIRRPARASDKQNLITNESEYEALHGRQEEYSHLKNRNI